MLSALLFCFCPENHFKKTSLSTDETVVSLKMTIILMLIMKTKIALNVYIKTLLSVRKSESS